MDSILLAIVLMCQVHTLNTLGPFSATDIQNAQRKCVAEILKCYYQTKGKTIQERM